MKLLKCNLGKCSTIVINGRVYKGGNLSVIDGKVFIDGKEQPEENAKIFEIKIVGNVEHLEVRLFQFPGAYRHGYFVFFPGVQADESVSPV